jgi:hypothetical protein
MYESKQQQPLSNAQFLRRLIIHLAVAMVLLMVSLVAGMAGYMSLEKLPSVDAFLNSAMLLGGMGPVNAPQTMEGKLFAGCYALYAGLVFIVTLALVLTPVVHRVIHLFHWNEKV